MSIKTLEILEAENKVTKAGKAYVRFKTSEGWMSCFDKKSCEGLKKLIGKNAECEVTESEDGNFQNIKKYLGDAAEENKEEEKPVKNVEVKPAFNQASMYVSYAKDIFCALMEREQYKNLPLPEVMKDAINLVEQAQASFK